MTSVEFTIQQAVRAIASRCDGCRTDDEMGFNGRDTSFGKSLAAIPHDNWSQKQLECAYKMMRTYRQQLLAVGIDYDAIAKPEVELERVRARREAATTQQATGRPQAQPRRMFRDEAHDRWILEFPYDRDVIYQLKAAGLKAFQQDGRWLWPVYPNRLEEVLPLLVSYKFDGASDAAAALAEKELAKAELAAASGAITAKTNVSITSASGKRTRPYQDAGVEYHLRVERVLNGDQMGLGKTIQGIATAVHADAWPALIVPPASLKLNWKKELTEWAPDLLVEVIETKRDVPSGVAQIYICNYDLLKGDDLFQVGEEWITKAELKERGLETRGRKKRHQLKDVAARLQALGLQQIFMDEFHYCKHADSQRSKAVKELARTVRIRVGFTGTPVENRPKELVNQLDILGRLNDFGGWKKFTERYCAGHQTRFGYDANGASNTEELHRRLRETCYIRRLKEAVLSELPPKVWSRIPIEITNRAEYDAAEADILEWLAENEGKDKAERASRAEELVRIATLQQIAAKGKLAGIQSWVEGFLEAGEKLALFAHHISVQDALLQAFEGAVAIKGGASPADTEEAKRLFNTTKTTNLIVCSIKAGGVGHTLHADGKCSNVALAEFPWSPAAQEQCEDRVHRMGQVAESVNVYELYAPGTIDEWILALLDEKRRVVDAVTDGATRDRLKVESVEGQLVERMKEKARAAKAARAA